MTEQIAFDSNEDILNQMEFNIQSYSGINGEIYGIRCGVHTLQLAILDALKIHEKSLAIIRKVVKKLRSTTNIQILKNAKLKTPLLDCPNRWFPHLKCWKRW